YSGCQTHEHPRHFADNIVIQFSISLEGCHRLVTVSSSIEEQVRHLTARRFAGRVVEWYRDSRHHPQRASDSLDSPWGAAEGGEAMYVERLRLTDFRNYADLDLTLPRGLVVFTGRNAQGKSNLLEAATLVATSKSFRTTSERETVRWGASTLFARVDATVVRRADTLHVEVVIADPGVPIERTPPRPVADPALPHPPIAPVR